MRPITCCLLLLIVLARAGALDASRWSHAADIRLNYVPARGVVEVSLPAEALDRANPDLSDLRVVSAGNREVGYVISAPGAAEQVVPLPVRLYNRTFLPGTSSRVTVDTGSGEMKNRVEIDTSGTNFRRTVRIEGSDDGRRWEVIRDNGMLFRVSEEGTVAYDKQEVTFPDNNQRYLRITVFNGAGDPGTITIKAVKLYRRVAGPAKRVPVPVQSFAVQQVHGTMAISADLGYRNLPLQRITLQVPDKLFFRRVSVLGRNAKTRKVEVPVEDAPSGKRTMDEPWVPLGSGAIYRYPGEASLAIDVDGANSRYLRVEIENENNPPLWVTGLTVQRGARLLQFKPKPGGRCRLYLGNPKAVAPSYDLVHYIAQLRAEGVTRASLGPVTPNPAYAAARPPGPPWSERHQIILWIALLAVFFVLLLMVRRQLRAAKTQEASRDDGVN